jgi:transposase
MYINLRKLMLKPANPLHYFSTSGIYKRFKMKVSFQTASGHVRITDIEKNLSWLWEKINAHAELKNIFYHPSIGLSVIERDELIFLLENIIKPHVENFIKEKDNYVIIRSGTIMGKTVPLDLSSQITRLILRYNSILELLRKARDAGEEIIVKTD